MRYKKVIKILIILLAIAIVIGIITLILASGIKTEANMSKIG